MIFPLEFDCLVCYTLRDTDNISEMLIVPNACTYLLNAKNLQFSPYIRLVFRFVM